MHKYLTLLFSIITASIVAAVASPALSQVQTVDEKLPCSTRYASELKLPISNTGKGSDWKTVMSQWSIQKNWGLDERVNFIKQAGSSAISMRVFYPKGSINPGNTVSPRGGAGFYATAGFDIPKSSACLSYSVMFDKGFKFAKGGKLPGLYGGIPPSGCIGDSEDYGFSTRYMWRENGDGSIYAYLPGKETRCGAYIGRGSFKFRSGRWLKLEQEIVMNNIGKADGVLKVWADNKLVINRSDITFREKEGILAKGLFFNTFFGGSSAEWASPQDQYSNFRDFRLYFN